MSVRVPVYTAQGRATDEAPGRRFSVRMDATPFVNAELRKGEIFSELADQANAFAQQRIKMINEQQYNDAALRIEEEMRQATYDLGKDNDYRNVLDGKNKWGQTMERIKTDVLSMVETPAVRKKIESEFDRSEVSARFSLRTVIDKKITAGEAAAIASRGMKIVADLSKPGTTTKQYDEAITKLTQAYQPGLSNGRFNPNSVLKTLNTVKSDIAGNVVDGYVGRTPMRAIDLLIALEQVIDIQNGVDIPDADLAELDAGGQYALHTLMQVGFDEATSILTKSINSATAFAAVIEKQEAEAEENFEYVVDAVKSQYHYYQNAVDQNDVFLANDLSEAVMSVPEIAKKVQDGGTISGLQIVKEIKDYLYDINEVDDATQRVFDADSDKSTTPFARETNAEAYDALITLRLKNDLTFDELTSRRGLLTKQDYTTFANSLLADQKDEQRRNASSKNSSASNTKTTLKNAKDTALRVAKTRFNYEAQSTDDDEMAKANKAAYFYVANMIEEAYLESLLPDAEELTPKKIQEIMQQGFEETEDQYHAIVLNEYEAYVTDDRTASALQDAGFVFSGTAAMLTELETWFNLEPRTPAQQRQYSRVKGRLKIMLDSGAFE